MIAQKIFTIEDFFKFSERLSDYKFEFVKGQIVPLYENEPVEASLVDYVLSPDFEEKHVTQSFAMPTRKHDILVSNLHGNLFVAFKTKPFRVYSQVTHVFIESTESSRMPDIVGVGKENEDRNVKHQVLNPVLMIEVLSKSTQAKDKSEKWEEYQDFETLKEYVMISHAEPKVYVYRKLTPTKWELEIFNTLEQTLYLSSIDFSTTLQEIYQDIVFGEVE